MTVILAVAFAGGIATTYYINLQTVPYTHRPHCVLFPPSYEKKMGENQFLEIKKENFGFILPAHHPEAIRVRKIASDIIQTLYDSEDVLNESSKDKPRMLKYTEVDQPKVSEKPAVKTEGSAESESDDSSARPVLGEVASESWGSGSFEEEDKWVEQNRRNNLPRKGFTGHLKDLNWEVLVIHRPILNAFCLPGGKIVVYSGLLEATDSDAELAAVLGHEVAHVVARHGMERLTAGALLLVLQFIALQFVDMPNLIGSASQLLFMNPFSRKHEIEADRIGLLLMATAGYDPQEAPKMYAKLDELGGTSEWAEYVSTHPSGKRRARLLKDASTMGEAVRVYEEKKQQSAGVWWFS